MNKAFLEVVKWYLKEIGTSELEIEQTVIAFSDGLQANDADIVGQLLKTLDAAEALALELRNDAVQKLIDLGKQLVVAECAMGKAEKLIAIRSILNLPYQGEMSDRIKSFKVRQFVEELTR